MGGRDAFKKFKHGISGYVYDHRRIDGGWQISIARYLQLFFCTCTSLLLSTRQKIGQAFSLLFEVHHALREEVPPTQLRAYQAKITRLLRLMVPLCKPFTKRKCNSIKYHWARHWGHTRLQLGCSAAEKSLERKLGESQKTPFKYTNHTSGEGDEVNCPSIQIAIMKPIPLQLQIAIRRNTQFMSKLQLLIFHIAISRTKFEPGTSAVAS